MHRSEGEYKLANVSRAWLGQFLCRDCIRLESDEEKFGRLAAMSNVVWAGVLQK